MMRWMLLVVLVVALSAAATALVQFVPTSASTDASFPVASRTGGPPPKAVVEGDLTYNFGVMPQNDKGRHEWIIRNEGKGPLKLQKGPSTCSCTIATFKGDSDELTVEPGEQEIIVLEWETRENNGPYSKGASILTNDPEHPKFDFAVEGTVRPGVLATVPGGTINFNTISNDETSVQTIALFSPDKADFEITSIRSSDALKVESQPLSADELKEVSEDAKAGYRLDVEVKPTVPLGSFREEILVKTNHPQQPEMQLLAVGRMAGPISFVPDRVQMLRVPSRQGGKEVLTVWVRGQDEGTHFEVARAPEKLKVEIHPADTEGTADDAGTPGRARRYQMTVTVPPGARPGLISGEVVLKTDHPAAGEVKVPVSVFVSNT